MSTTPTTVGIPAQHWSAKHYAVLIGLMIALVGGAFGVYALTDSEPVTTAPSTVQVENGRAGDGGCSSRLSIGGGALEGHTYSDTCASKIGPVVPRGLSRR